MARFKKKPVVIEAVQFTRETLSECIDFFGDVPLDHVFVAWVGPQGELYDNEGTAPPDMDTYPILQIRTLEGVMTGHLGDWIIKGVQGEFYPCKPDIFADTYEAVEDDES